MTIEEKQIEEKRKEFFDRARGKKYFTTYSFLNPDDGKIYHWSENHGIDVQDICISLEAHKKNFSENNEDQKKNLIFESTAKDLSIKHMNKNDPIRIVLRHGRCPGDILPLTCLVRDIKKQYKDKILLTVHTPSCPQIWDNNPYLTTFDWDKADYNLGMDYGKYGTQKSNSWQNHFAHAFRMYFEQETKIQVTPGSCYPEIYLSQEEKNRSRDIKEEYWLIWPGNKEDCQIKSWPDTYWQDVIDHYQDKTFVQVGQSKHGHKPLKGVIDYIDKTENVRDLFRLMYHARGSIGYISFHLHLAAAFKKPAIVLAGAREPASFIKYNNQFVISTMGAVPCGNYKGCWGGQITGKNKKYTKVIDICPNSLCNYPLCMMLIKPRMVIDAIEVYDKGRDYTNINDFDKFKTLQQIIIDERMIDCIPSDKKEGHYLVRFKDRENPDIIKHTMADIDQFKKILKPFIKKEDNMEAISVGPCTTGSIVERESNKEEQSDIELREGMKYLDKPIFKIVCNVCYFGGGEKTAINICNLMLDADYVVQLIPSYRGTMCDEFKAMLPKSDDFKVRTWEDVKDKCDIFMIHCNDLVWDFNTDRFKDFFKVECRRKVMSINFAIGNIGVAEWTRYMDVYICQSSDLIRRLKSVKGMEDKPIIRLHPPAKLDQFYNTKYDRNYDQLRLIRHSGQAGKKYYNNMNEIVDNIFKIRDCRIMLMPAPIFLDKKLRIQTFRYNAEPIHQFLTRGNLFWYFVDPRKFKESGANCVLEAMASGLPVLCNDNGGLVDIVNVLTGWVCKDFKEMYDIIKNVTMDELREKGENARNYAKRIFDPQRWVDIITGKDGNSIEKYAGIINSKEEDETDKWQYPNKITPILKNNNASLIPSLLTHPKVSFIMPTYGRYDEIHKAIDSILAQKDISWELIIIDDGIDKKKEDIIAEYQLEYPEQIKYTSKRHCGCWGNYSKYHALQFVQGEFCFFIDDDDEARDTLVSDLYDSHYDLIWHRVKFASGKVFGIQDEDFADTRICSPSILIRTTFLLKTRKTMQDYFRYRNMDYRVWEYIKDTLNPRIKRVNDCYYFVYDKMEDGSMPTLPWREDLFKI